MNITASANSFEIFVSYSHLDARIVKPMVQYLRPTGVNVFRDEDGILPGKKWAAVLIDVIESCRLMYLFWCIHSACSNEVRKEYERALGLAKDIVPVLLDNTPLPQSLAEYQWVDLRDVVGKHEESMEETMSLEEGKEQQRLDREAYGYRPYEFGYHCGDFFRKGWREHNGQYVRTIQVDKQVSEANIRRAAELLSANLESRMSSKLVIPTSDEPKAP